MAALPLIYPLTSRKWHLTQFKLSLYLIKMWNIFIALLFRLAQTVKLMVSMGLLLTYPLQFFVAVHIMWSAIEEKFGPLKHSTYSQLLFRCLLVLVTCKKLNILWDSCKIRMKIWLSLDLVEHSSKKCTIKTVQWKNTFPVPFQIHWLR